MAVAQRATHAATPTAKKSCVNPQLLLKQRCVCDGKRCVACNIYTYTLSIYQAIYQAIYHQPIYQTTHPSTSLSSHLSLYPSNYLSIYLSINLSTYLSTYEYTYQSINPSTYLSTKSIKPDKLLLYLLYTYILHCVAGGMGWGCCEICLEAVGRE